MKHSRMFSILLMGAAGILMTLSNFSAQMAIKVNQPISIPSLQLVFCRHVVQLLFVLPGLVYNRTKFSYKGKKLDLFFLAIAGYFSIVFIFFAIRMIPLGDVTVLMFLTPALSTIIARVVLSEAIQAFEVVCGFIGFAGVVVFARPTLIFGKANTEMWHVMFTGHKHMSVQSTENLYLLGLMWGLLGTTSLSLYYVMTRKVSLNGGNFLLNILYPSLVAFFVTPIFMVILQEWPVIHLNMYAVMFSLLVGLTSFIGLTCVSTSLSLDSVSALALIRNLDVVYAFGLQYIASGIEPTIWNIIGAAIIMSSTSAIVINKFLQNCNASKEAAVEDKDEFLQRLLSASSEDSDGEEVTLKGEPAKVENLPTPNDGQPSQAAT